MRLSGSKRRALQRELDAWRKDNESLLRRTGQMYVPMDKLTPEQRKKVRGSVERGSEMARNPKFKELFKMKAGKVRRSQRPANPEEIPSLKTFERVPIEGSKHFAYIPMSQLEKYTMKKHAKKTSEKSASPKTGKGRKVRAEKTNGAAEQKIHVVEKKNPRREGTSRYKRFEAYKSGMTVAQVLAKGHTMSGVAQDVKDGLIRLS